MTFSQRIVMLGESGNTYQKNKIKKQILSAKQKVIKDPGTHRGQ